MRPYPAYKDSGVEWLGEVPEGWELKPVKAIASCNDETLPEDTDPELEIEYVEISGVDANAGIVETTATKFGPAPSRARRIVRHGDVLISTVRTYLRAIAQAVEPAPNLIASTGFAVLRPKAIDSGFLGYACRAEYFISEVISRSVGVSYPAINASQIGTLAVPLPPLPEQQAIARFLDKEVAKIDALVAEQRRLIALLAEKRQAVISHAVTKGLNPATPLKPSGIDWLGDIPEGWEVVAIKRIVSMRSGDAITAEDIEPEGEFPVFGGNGLRGYTKAFTHAGSYILIGRQGALCGNINHAEGRFWASEHAVVVTPIVSLDLRWLGATLETMNLNQYSTSAAQPGLSVEVIAKLRLAVPPLDEQGAIAAHIREKTAQFDALTDAATSAISLLQERRAALISAAVTGKIDLRPHFAQSLSEPEIA